VEDAPLRALPLSLAAAGVILAACTSGSSTGSAASLLRGPYLQATQPHATTICWRTKAPSPSVVHIVGGADVGPATSLEVDHAVTLSGLAEGHAYTYRIDGDEHDHAFSTAPGPEASFRALLFGDSGMGTREQGTLARRMEGESFDIILHAGDITYPGGRDDEYDRRFFPYYAAILATHPFFPAPGNHDLGEDNKAEVYKKIFHVEANNPERTRLYYSFEWGCAKVVSIESYLLFKTPGPHMDWLEHELAANDRPWLVLLMHVPMYSTGTHGDSVELARQIEPLVAKYKVRLVLAGHDHLYARGAKDGWTWVVSGGGGGKLYPVTYHHPFDACTESAFHYVLLDFSKDRIAEKMVRLDGSVGDSFEIAR
jgi:predicted phosphodiesterase